MLLSKSAEAANSIKLTVSVPTVLLSVSVFVPIESVVNAPLLTLHNATALPSREKSLVPGAGGSVVVVVPPGKVVVVVVPPGKVVVVVVPPGKVVVVVVPPGKVVVVVVPPGKVVVVVVPPGKVVVVVVGVEAE